MTSITTHLRRIKRKITKKLFSRPDTFTLATISRSDKPVVWLLGSEDFGNLGDHMIAVAELHFFNKYFSEYDVIEVSARNYWEQRDNIIASMQPEDIIFGTGGGNFGNQYPASEAIRYDFIKTFPNNKIVIMPQTVWYTKNEEGKEQLAEAVELYGSHTKLILTAREQYTLKFLNDNFKNKIAYVPDMVLSEKPYQSNLPAEKLHSSKKALLCLRTDLETILTSKERAQIKRLLKSQYNEVKAIDTQKNYLISTERRNAELKEFFDELSSASLLITDRLHGMVFAALCGTPCIVFDNYNNKVKGIHEWIKELPYVRYKGTDKNITDDINELKNISDCTYYVEGMEKHFADYADMIKEAFK